MKQITMYQCEICHETHVNADCAMSCEAGHYGLTTDEYLGWKKLSHEAAKAGMAVGLRKCPETDKAFDEACKALAAFETDHDLAQRRKPTDFYR